MLYLYFDIRHALNLNKIKTRQSTSLKLGTISVNDQPGNVNIPTLFGACIKNHNSLPKLLY